MVDSHISQSSTETMRRSVLIGGMILLAAVIVGIYFWWTYLGDAGGIDEALKLAGVVLFGLALVVGLMAGLTIVYAYLKLANSNQALALPEGSIRALIAFSMVLIFVCLAAFLYNGVNNDLGAAVTVRGIPLTQIEEMKSNFVVVYEPDMKDGSPSADKDGKQLFTARYYIKRSTDADDFAKQIFTTLATVFVSVISFYFGSSTTTSGVGAGANAARKTDERSDKRAGGGQESEKKPGDQQKTNKDINEVASQDQQPSKDTVVGTAETKAPELKDDDTDPSKPPEK